MPLESSLSSISLLLNSLSPTTIKYFDFIWFAYLIWDLKLLFEDEFTTTIFFSLNLIESKFDFIHALFERGMILIEANNQFQKNHHPLKATLSIPLPKPAAGVSGPPIYEIKLSYLPPESILA